MRIALLTPELDPSYGWARHALELASALSEQGVEVVALTQPGPRSPAGSAALADVRPVLPRLVPLPRWFLPRALAATSRVRRAVSGCDLLHVIAEPYSVLAGLAAGKRPLVVTAHGTYVPHTVRRQIAGGLYRQAYRRAHLIAVSHYTAAQVQAVLPDADLTVIHNGVHVARFQVPAPAPAKTGPTVLASGGVKLRKGTHVLVAAMALVRERVPGAQLVVTGRQDDLPYLARVKRQIAERGLESAVHLVGQIPEPDLRGWYQHADVFALPSLAIGDRFEGFGLVFLEASASGLPVIGTTGSGVEEVVIDGETGLLVPQDNAPALADAIIRLLTDAPLRQRMGAAGRDYAATQDWSVVAGQVIAVYRQLLA
jgi:glycosyltransferase involved in cell wall biosynthesis